MIVIEEEKVRHMIESMFRKGRKPIDTEWNDAIDAVMNEFLSLPTFDTDMSKYSDRLWKLAYERGKTEGIVRCKDCTYYDWTWVDKLEKNNNHYCPIIDSVIDVNFYCAKGELRRDETN